MKAKSMLLAACILAAVTGLQAQTPVMRVDGKSGGTDVYLQTLDVQVEVTGNIATTGFTMTFKNRTGRILEGELLFPLPDGVTVSRYALDINGRMREAVPVEKAKATQVFEEIEQRRVDPGLLERVEGNNFRTRIYPIPANGTRTIAIGYEQELPADNNMLRYRLPMDYKEAIENFSLKATVWQSRQAPHIETTTDELRFDAQGTNFVSTFARRNHLPAKLLTFSLPVPDDVPQVYAQSASGSWYFMASCYPEAEQRHRQWSNRIGIIWDASLSGLYRNTGRELELLNAIIRQKRNLTITLSLLNNRCTTVGEFRIEDGEWGALREAINKIDYDGGTNFRVMEFPATAQEILLFSDGLSTLSEAEPTANPGRPIHCIVSAPKADYSALKWLSAQTGGKFVNLNALSNDEAQNELMNETFSFLGIKKPDSVREVYPSITMPVRGNFSVAGIMDAAQADITLLFGYGNKVTVEKTVRIDARAADNQANIHRVWAQKKINELDMRYEKNRNELTELGQQFGIVTRNTSLIVLETLQDYITYHITPPSELRSEYLRWQKGQQKQVRREQQSLLAKAKTAAATLKNWWDKDFEPVKPKYPTPDDNNRSVGATPTTMPTPAIPILRQTAGNITGTVTDENGEPVVGATIIVKNTHQGTITDENGRYSINVSAGTPILEVMFVGYTTQEVAVGDRSSIDFRLTEHHQMLEEVVVVRSYGISHRRERRQRRARAEAHHAMETMDVVSDNVMVEEDIIAIEEMEAPAAPSVAQTLEGRLYGVAANAEVLKQSVATQASGSTPTPQPKISLTPVRQDSEYMKALTEKSRLAGVVNIDDDYRDYLRLRADYINTPTFYFDMADWFFRHNDRTRALRILTTIADLDLENASLFRLLGYRLKEYAEYDLETYICRKVIRWRPMEPQSYRDYALALADAGRNQEAIDTLYATITRSYTQNISQRSTGIEEVLITELNQLISAGTKPKQAIDPALVKAIPVDIRVVINWNMNSTDIDLHVTDPIGEVCSYRHQQTSSGGRISQDITQGYGPEQFLLKKAIKGRYQVHVNYYGDSQVKAEGPSTVMVEIYTGYGSSRQQRRVVCLQLDGKVKRSGNGLVQVAEFEF